jgi:hypothetical protein
MTVRVEKRIPKERGTDEYSEVAAKTVMPMKPTVPVESVPMKPTSAKCKS